MTQREGEEGGEVKKGGELNLEWESSHTGKEEVEGVHLSRLRTDTPTIHQIGQTHQTQQTLQTNQKKGGGIQEEEEYKCTCHVYGQTHQYR